MKKIKEEPLPCECPAAGWCNRHSIEKHSHWHKLCQNNDRYRMAWDAGRGPGQEKKHTPTERELRQARIAKSVQRRKNIIGWVKWMRKDDEIGMGDTLSRLIAATSSKQVKKELSKILSTCSCSKSQAIAKMNNEHPY